MNKKVISLGVLAIGGLLVAQAAPVFAEEAEVDCVLNPTNEACIVTTIDEPVDEPFDPDNEVEPIDDTAAPDNTETDIDEVETEEEEEAPLWPMYLSLGALGVAILTFIILNLAGGKVKNK